MTQLLEQAMTEVQKLPEREQNVIASLIFEEMLDERKWDEAFANSQDQLSTLADEALAEYQSRKTLAAKRRSTRSLGWSRTIGASGTPGQDCVWIRQP